MIIVFFFKKNKFNFNQNKSFKKNLGLAEKKSEEILKEFSSGDNQILQSFTKEYQKKIRNLKQDLKPKGKKKQSLELEVRRLEQKPCPFF